MSTAEVANAQYCAFLNSVAASDPHRLWDSNMGDADELGGIERSGSSGSYTYSVISGRGDCPVNWVSQKDALRFANWLHNGQPVGEQGLETTESGAYLLSSGEVVREDDAQFFLPSADEWHKAAFYKGSGLDAGYWDYPTSHDESPLAELPPGGDNSANLDDALGEFVDVGSYGNTTSPYGLFDMAGNAWEWTETYGDDEGEPYICGGGFGSGAGSIHASYLYECEESDEWDLGFRIAAAVPEPASLGLFMLAATMLMRRR